MITSEKNSKASNFSIFYVSVAFACFTAFVMFDY